MKPFLKYTLWGIVIQVILGVILVVMGNLFPALFVLTDAYLRIYLPVLMVLATYAPPGESAMIGVPLIGIPLALLLYGLIIGYAIWCFKRLRTKDKLP